MKQRMISCLLAAVILAGMMLPAMGQAVSAGQTAADGSYTAAGTVDFDLDRYTFELTLTVSGGKISRITQKLTSEPGWPESEEEYQPDALDAFRSAFVGKDATLEALDAVTGGTPKYSFGAMKEAAKTALSNAPAAGGSASGDVYADGLYTDSSVETVGLASNYKPSLSIRIENGVFTAIDVSASTEAINMSFLNNAVAGIRTQLIGKAATQSAIDAIDAVSSATISTDALREEAKIALSKNPVAEGYTLSYNLNGAPGTVPDPAVYAPGTSITVIADPVWQNHIFQGWSGIEITNGKFTMPYENVTLTAQWTETHADGVYTDSSVIEEVFSRYQYITSVEVFNEQIYSVSVDVYDTEEKQPVGADDLEWLLDMSATLEYVNQKLQYEDADSTALEPLYAFAAGMAGQSYEEDGVEITVPLYAQYIIQEAMLALEGNPAATGEIIKAGQSRTAENLSGSSYRFTLDVSGYQMPYGQSCRLVYAFYDEYGKLDSVREEAVTWNTFTLFRGMTISRPAGAGKCRLFVLDRSTYKPLCAAAEVKFP